MGKLNITLEQVKIVVSCGFFRAMLCISAAYMPSCGVRHSVTFVYCVETAKIQPSLLWNANRNYPSCRMVLFFNDLE